MHSQQSSSKSRAASWAGAAGLAGALALSACLTDGPNRTGGAYLERHGLLLETPLHRIELKDFPVDSFFVGDLDPTRMGDSLFLAGRWGGFTSEARMAFQVADTSLLDSLGPTGSLRLALSFPRPNRGFEELKKMIAGVDSMNFQVESWAYEFSHTDKARPDSVRALHTRFLVRQDTGALFPADFRRSDLIRVAVKTAYDKAGGRDSVQVFPLPNLRAKLMERSGEGRQWIVLLQLTHVPDSSADSAMLRFGGNQGTLLSPMLLFGDPDGTSKHPATAGAKQRLFPAVVDDRFSIATRYRHAGSPTALLTGKTRGLHLRFNRDSLLKSLDQELRRMGSSLAVASDGEFDLAYYVPFAQLTLPIAAPSEIEGGFPVDMRLFSDLDSLLPGDTVSVERRLPKDEDRIVTYLFERNDPARVSDSVLARFENVEGLPDLNRLILWGKDTARKDTSFLHDGESREIVRSTSASRADQLVLSVAVVGEELVYRLHLNTKREEEGYIFKDASTGKPLTELAQRIPRFLKPEDGSLTLRATRGFQRMLNRARLGQEIEGDFFIQPTRNAAADTASNLFLPYPVLGEIEPGIESGRLAVDIVLYLFPLKAR